MVINAQGCDEFTRNFLTKMGVRIPPSTDIPDDPYTNYRKAVRHCGHAMCTYV